MKQNHKIESDINSQALFRKEAFVSDERYVLHKEKCKHRMTNGFCTKSNKPCPLNLFVTFNN